MPSQHDERTAPSRHQVALDLHRELAEAVGDPRTIGAAVARFVVDRGLASAAIVSLFDPDTLRLDHIAAATDDPAFDDARRRGLRDDLIGGTFDVHRKLLLAPEPLGANATTVEELASLVPAELAGFVRDTGLRSLHATLLVGRGQPVGCLLVAERDRPLDGDDRALLAELAAVAGGALGTARLFQRLERVVAVADSAAGRMTLSSLFDALLRRLQDLVAADTVALLLLDEDGANLRSVMRVGFPPDEDEVVVPLGAGFAGRVASERRAVLVEEAEHFPFVARDIRAAGLRTVLGVPVVDGDTVLGVLHVGSKRPRYLGRDEREVLELTADRLAVAIRQHRTEAELQRTAAYSQAVLETVIDAIITIDDRGTVVMANPAAERMFGYPLDELVGQNVALLMPEPDRSRHDGYLERYLETGEAHIIGVGREIRARRRDGTEFPADLGISEVRVDGGRRFFTGILRDATERHAAEAKLRHQALHDALTGLPNRVLFADHLDLALARSARSNAGIGVLFIDLDRFKTINDSLGHAVGDDLLRQAAHRLRRAVRPADTVARLGGDEFGVLVEDPRTPPAVYAVAERIHRLFQHPFHLEGQDLRCTVSIGIAHAGEGDGDDQGPDLLRHADAALYLAKERGRDRYEIFDEPMRTRLHARLRTENELHRALDLGHLEPWFQPIVDLRDDRVVAVEALARWRHPERGTLVGADFIPLAEETGLIVPIGRRVIDLVAEERRSWAAALGDAAPDVTVNLSAREVAASGLRRLVDEGAPEGLWVEITESALLQDFDGVVADLARVRERGIRVAIDDFGAGYSSLSRLRQFPADAIKIDKRFIAGLGQDPRDTAVVSAITRLAEAMGIAVIAEGVETEDQLEHLRAVGCTFAQGFVLSPPVPGDDVAAIVAGRVR